MLTSTLTKVSTTAATLIASGQSIIHSSSINIGIHSKHDNKNHEQKYFICRCCQCSSGLCGIPTNSVAPPQSTTNKPTAAAVTTTTTTSTTTITSDPGILCFHHCNVKVFCFTLPHICPQCKTALDTHPSVDQDSDDDENSNDSVCHIMNSLLLPFCLPYQFMRANQYPCAIVLRLTAGDFLNDYNDTTDLHIAVTTSTGCVVEFDRHGLRRHRTANMTDWWQCLLVGDVPEPWYVIELRDTGIYVHHNKLRYGGAGSSSSSR
ncbi:uncharacterized protein LOC133336716 [Musca vetustissima]|uniref:uncharacterized protein LOC133336716 n=1 Tax=Musca vetustissima TaxID=27455 RepID=UPI002AB78AAB|nr:uncharacterized protein LOC133336716 [Musca vetustissima]